MIRVVRMAPSAAVAIGLLLALRLGSFAWYTARPGEQAVVRLAWRARGQRVNDCRRRTPDELAKLPAHMRQEEICEGRLLPYRLVVAVDSASRMDRLVHAAGAREDRPLYVDEDLPVAPGSHRVTVTFTLVGKAATPPPGDSSLATPSRLALDTILDVGTRRIILVTLDEQREQLVVRRGSTR